MTSFQKKTKKCIIWVMVIYTLLVATHKGEFWPLSIYPMFSQGGNPWTRALVRDFTTTPDSIKWQNTNFDELSGAPVALQDYGVDAIDFANFVSKTDEWDLKRRKALQKMFGRDQIGDRKLMVMKVSGRLVGKDSVITMADPLMLVTADTVYADPNMALKQN